MKELLSSLMILLFFALLVIFVVMFLWAWLTNPCANELEVLLDMLQIINFDCSCKYEEGGF